MLAALAAAARSASSQMIIGSEPPSSSVTRLVPLAHSAMICSPTGVEPVKAILRTSGCVASARAGLRAAAGDDVEHAGGQPALVQQLGEAQRGQRRRAGRLGDDGVAGHERRGELVGQQRRREVPRHDRAHDAERPSQHDAVDAGVEVRRVRAAQRLREPDVVHQRVDRLGDLDAGVAQRLALLAGEQRDQLVEVLLDVVSGMAEDLAALGDGERRPLGERPARRPHGRVDVVRRAAGDLGEDLAVGGVGDGQRVTRVAVLGAVDEGAAVCRRDRHLGPRELWCPLLAEGREALVCVLGAEELLDQLALQRQPVIERRLDALVDGALDLRQRQRRQLASRSTCASNAAASSNSSETRPSRSASSGPS